MNATIRPRRAHLGLALPAVAALTLLLATAWPVAATRSGSSCLVTSPGHGKYSSLQLAVEQAHSGATLTISGLCGSAAISGKDLALLGISSAVIDGGGATVPLSVSDSTSSIRNLTIQGAGENLAGVSLSAASLAVAGSTIRDNYVGLAVADDASLTISGSTVSGNDRGIEAIGPVSITNSTVSDNAYGLFGYGPLTITGSTFSGNYNAGVVVTTAGGAISNSTITGNGEGVSNTGVLTISGTTITGNGSSWIDGGGLANLGLVTFVGPRSTISGNLANEGGGIYNYAGLVSGCRFLSYGGGNTPDNSYDWSGGVDAICPQS
jgi:nitrous oxidase accessory protein NosD